MSAQDKVSYYINQLDKELGKYPALNNLEKQTQVPKSYAVLGVFAIIASFIFFNIFAHFLTTLLGWALPTYLSLRALDTPGSSDDQQWLTYWVVFGALNIFEQLISVPYWFPYYYTFKSIAVLWLMLPQTRGAEVLYTRFLRGAAGGKAAPSAAPVAHTE